MSCWWHSKEKVRGSPKSAGFIFWELYIFQHFMAMSYTSLDWSVVDQPYRHDTSLNYNDLMPIWSDPLLWTIFAKIIWVSFVFFTNY